MAFKQLKNRSIILVLLILNSANSIIAQTGIHGSITVSGSNQDLNVRTRLTSNASAGSSSISVSNSALTGTYFSGSLTAGDLVMIIQMQGASINNSNSASYGGITSYNNAGLYELRCVSSVPNSNTINLTVPLENNYTASGHTQVIRVPRYSTFNLPAGNSIRPALWDGNVGGVTVIEIQGNATINGTINATGRGFRGGAFENNTQGAASNVTIFLSSNDADGGNKGESIAGFETEYDAIGGRFGRGAPANGGGGGNSHNAGGGGGANAGNVSAWNGLGNPNLSGVSWTAAWNLEGASFSTNTSSGGGRGGYTYGSTNQNAITTGPGAAVWGGNSRRNTGGYGGRPLDYTTGRLFMGGGGGAGDGNNNAASGGARGGGLVFIVCYGNIIGVGNIVANGETAANTSSGHNDAPGGGGGGGTIILSATGTISNSLVLNANGGNGGNQLITNAESEGPGGGGGGGYIAVSSGTPTRTTNAGLNGTTSSSSLTEFIPNGATRGGVGTSNASFNAAIIIGDIEANGGGNLDYCESILLNATLSDNAVGTWSILTGLGGSLADLNDPNTLFTGDSFANYTLQWTVVNNLCQISSDTILLTSICQPLPVNLIDIYVEQINEDIILSWITASEEDMHSYRIERQNREGIWVEIGIIYIPNNSYSINNYSFNDPNPMLGENNYRLRMVNADLTYEYSKVVSISRSNSKNVFIGYPNPTKGIYSIEGRFGVGAELTVYSIHGQVLHNMTSNGEQVMQIDLSTFPTGMYIIKIVKNGEVVESQTILRE